MIRPGGHAHACREISTIKGIVMRQIAARSAAKQSRSVAAAVPRGTRTKLSFAIAAVLSSSAAMHAAPARAAEASSDTTLEEVLVTARKRTENLQDVPISIDVF